MSVTFEYKSGFRVGFVMCSEHGQVGELAPTRVPHRGEPLFSPREVDAAMYCSKCADRERVLSAIREQLKKKSACVLRRRFLQ